MTHFTGTLNRDTGKITEHSAFGFDMGVVVQSAAPGAPIYFHGTHNSHFFRGQVSPDRTAWSMRSQFGFVVSGACRWDAEARVYRLEGEPGDAPAALALPGESAP